MRSFVGVRRAARVAALVVAAATVGLAASCRDVVTDDVVDAEAALCSSFEACEVEAAACQRVASFFDVEDDATFDEYLAYYERWKCGAGCGPVDVCLDFPALCAPTREACEHGFDCCNASTGAAACHDARCCFGLGVVCDGPEDCCPLEDDTPVDCFARSEDEDAPKTCGGVAECKLRDERCGPGDTCCGKASCVEEVCTVDTCVDRDAPCRPGERCCIEGDECDDGECKPAPEPCSDPNAAQSPPCCTEANGNCEPGGTPCCGGAICSQTLTGEWRCGGENCLPLGSDCSTDEGCCTNGMDDIRCIGLGQGDEGQRICKPIDCQLQLGAPCNDELRCCAGLNCVASPDGDVRTCQPECAETRCHDPRDFDAPIGSDRSCMGPDEAACVTTVCEADPFCCCVRWDESCILAAIACLGDVPSDGSGSASSGGGG